MSIFNANPHARCDASEQTLRARIDDLEQELYRLRELLIERDERNYTREREQFDRMVAIVNLPAAAAIRSVAPTAPAAVVERNRGPQSIRSMTAATSAASLIRGPILTPTRAGFQPSATARAAAAAGVPAQAAETEPAPENE